MPNRYRLLTISNEIAMKSKSIAVLSFVSSMLGGCGTVHRPPEDTFSLVENGQIKPGQGAAFIDCVVDGFRTVKVVPRSGATRIELATNGAYILMSAEVSNTGEVELFESSYAALVSTKNERTAFKACLDKFQ